MTILELISANPDGIGVREAARQTGVDRSAVSRVLSAFEELGYAEQSDVRGLYRLGPRMWNIAASLNDRDSLVGAAEPILRRLVSQFNETCYVVAYDRDVATYRLRIDSEQSIRSVVPLGSVAPLTESAPGVAILSAMAATARDNALARFAKENQPAGNEKSVDLRLVLERAQRKGFSVSSGEWTPNEGSVSAAFFDKRGHCAGAITLSGPLERIRHLSFDTVGNSVRDAAIELSTRWGGHGPDYTEA